MVEAFNIIQTQHLLELGRPQGQDQMALPVAGDDERAKRVVHALGFDAGSLHESWRQEPETSVHGTDDTAAG